MREHTFKNDGKGKCAVCGSGPTAILSVPAPGVNEQARYTVATHPLLLPGEDF